ncbi:hypothetical protein GM921_03745 [Pedobacter sp. LMG 31464]|uniref:HNH nuclease domain-containing protein n=1 Tax=Pedobacter planticolens TaxID=2679964 RepID=A0A923IUB0_9SPHI|nr:HNH endonuclease signature motif containing protein [Pedobacter planticolens]MBB2144583.1 hypothetical protein [Pedobacter planticolens]
MHNDIVNILPEVMPTHQYTLNKYDELTKYKVLDGFLNHNLSHRRLQREILNLPAPPRGGGFEAMAILHHYGLKGDFKGKGFDVLTLPTFAEAKNLVDNVENVKKEAENFYILKQYINPNNNPTETASITKRRIYQEKLREIVLDNYNNQCALCDIDKQDLLICSHIIPWGADERARLDPTNAICFCVLHDRLFDKGYFSLDNRLNIKYTKKADLKIKSILAELTFAKPKINSPNFNYLKYHFEQFL